MPTWFLENQHEFQFNLDEVIIFLERLAITEFQHDKELQCEAKKHVENLVHYHAAINQAKPVVS